MKSVDEADAMARLEEILKEAQRQPLAIRRHGEDVVAIMSISEYERLRSATVRALLDVRREVTRLLRLREGDTATVSL